MSSEHITGKSSIICSSPIGPSFLIHLHLKHIMRLFEWCDGVKDSIASKVVKLGGESLRSLLLMRYDVSLSFQIKPSLPSVGSSMRCSAHFELPKLVGCLAIREWQTRKLPERPPSKDRAADGLHSV